jgi:hypothetical protein
MRYGDKRQSGSISLKWVNRALFYAIEKWCTLSDGLHKKMTKSTEYLNIMKFLFRISYDKIILKKRPAVPGAVRV